MIKNTVRTLFVCSLVFSLVSFSSGTIAAKKAPKLSTADQFYIADFELDLSQCCLFEPFINEDQFGQVADMTMRYKLKESGIQLLDEFAEGAVQLEVFIDYYRHFYGDKTPFPIARLGFPEHRLTLKATRDKNVLVHYRTKTMLGSSVDLPGLPGEGEVVKDYGYAVNVGGLMAQEIIEQVKGASFNKNVLAAEYLAPLIALQKEFSAAKGKEVVNVEYIPQQVIDGYLIILSGDDDDAIREAYKTIGRGWYNSEALFTAIAENIRRESTVTDSKDIKRVREAMKALASSGMEKYRPFFEELETTEGVHKKIAGEADDSLKYLTQRAALVGTVHNTRTMDSSEPWLINQLANRVRCFDPKVSVAALKEIYRDHRDNVYLQETMVSMLREEAMRESYKTYARADAHAWAIRILGLSENEAYLPVLKDLEENAAAEKVSEYAEEFYEELEEAIEDKKRG